MAKRKNPLKDLDAFLKQEAKNFVQPKKVEEPAVVESKIEVPPSSQTEAPKAYENTVSIDSNKVREFLSSLKKSNDPEFYNVLLKSVEEAGTDSSENKMLINTILYLKDKDNWKDSIKDYWS